MTLLQGDSEIRVSPSAQEIKHSGITETHLRSLTSPITRLSNHRNNRQCRLPRILIVQSRYMVIPSSFDNSLSKDEAKEKSLFSFAHPEQAMNGLFRALLKTGLVDCNSGTHGRGNSNLFQVYTLGRSRFGLDQCGD